MDQKLIANSTIWFGIWADQTGLTSFGKIYELLSWTKKQHSASPCIEAFLFQGVAGEIAV